MSKHITIGCYSAFWGDTAGAARQLVEADNKLDYLVADYLAEVTIGLLARTYKFGSKSKSKSKPTSSPPVGYISEFLTLVLAPLLDKILTKGLKVITNAGGLDPVGLKKLIEEYAEKVGHGDKVKVAAVYGDDILDQKDQLLSAGVVHRFDPLAGAGSPEAMLQQTDELISLNAYIGAGPITEALRGGANIVVTGRCVDSASIVAPLAFEYGWDYAALSDQRTLDRLASASLAGHILECGAQATGGNYTDWRESAFSPHGGWVNMGYPIVTFSESGGFAISKPGATGGVVNTKSVCEQMLYEVLDPENYILPDVVLDLSHVELSQASRDVVHVSGAKGKPPTPWLKCTAIAHQGYRASTDYLVFGIEAESKGLALGRAILERVNRIVAAQFGGKVSPIAPEQSEVTVIGGASKVPSAPAPAPAPAPEHVESTEIVVRISAVHERADVLNILGQEVSSFITSSAPGICLLSAGRPRSSPNFTTASVLVERQAVVPLVRVGLSGPATDIPFVTKCCKSPHPSKSLITMSSVPPDLLPKARVTRQSTPLIAVAIARSGDKGDTSNVAIIARHPAFYPYILAQVTPELLSTALGRFITKGGTIARYEVPGVKAVNFVITKCLGGGGLASLRIDKQGKGYAQLALAALSIDIPLEVLANTRL
ncbi:hypothetical protein EG329_004601 [Mollisiaceae sp. DMI_Dod_QoI]|nr:hypothetical protein EG329_004601 [Helotiales sp. DMI_Dod_QoI]